jgi:hypothetical protein
MSSSPGKVVVAGGGGSSTGGGFMAEVKFFVRGITFLPGDFVSLFSLFFDNLSTLLGFAGAILGLNPTSAHLQEILYQRIIPAAGIMLFAGNVYYTYQAIRMARTYGRPFTAQPYGFNTAGGFPFIFGTFQVLCYVTMVVGFIGSSLTAPLRILLCCSLLNMYCINPKYPFWRHRYYLRRLLFLPSPMHRRYLHGGGNCARRE